MFEKYLNVIVCKHKHSKLLWPVLFVLGLAAPSVCAAPDPHSSSRLFPVRRLRTDVSRHRPKCGVGFHLK